MSRIPSCAANVTESLALLPKLPPLDNTFGAVLIGTFMSLILYGMTLHQLYRYLLTYATDRLWVRCTVYSTIMLETVHMAFCCHVCYWYLVTNYFNPSELLFGSWSIKIVLILSGIIIIISQSFFAWRVYLVGPRFRLLVLVAMFLLVGELAFFSAATIETFMIPTFQEFEHLEWLISVGSAQAITADTLLTTVLIITLHRSRTGIKRTDSILDVLILYAISTGLLTTIFNALAFLSVVLLPKNMIYIAFSIIVTKLYANTLLVALNTRDSLSKRCLVQASDGNPYGSSAVFGTTVTQHRVLPPPAIAQVSVSKHMMSSRLGGGRSTRVPGARETETDFGKILEIKDDGFSHGAVSRDTLVVDDSQQYAK
ncbi:hypothetical protein BD311DRAFT_797575 [Dichomitus squalens]|uniref:DUF6534 domain-containing protein n=1 Tax=Dichomitus squalens TaxID=114155 RepID=A0A4V2K074_9APHY|nr:hypothetical protein BD311DRAFT_797575 [Dichomitus squalens]